MALEFHTIDTDGTTPVILDDASGAELRWVLVETDEDAEHYGLTIGDYAPADLRALPFALAGYPDEILTRFRTTKTEVADPPAPVPASVSALRAQLALDQAGLLDGIEAYMADPATPKAHKIFWAKADTFLRNSAQLAEVAAALSITDDQLDGLFTAAAALEL